MPYGFYISAEGAHVQSKRLEVLSNNLANVDTPGFKRDLAVLQARYSEATERGYTSPGSGTLDDLSGGVLVRQSQTDFSSGTLKRTDIPTDFAINGDGFFVVRKGNQDLLSRAGNFRFTEAGQLTTQEGYAVLDEDGSPIEIDTAAGPWKLSRDGAIEQAGGRTALSLVKPASLGDLVKTGENLFRALAPTSPVDPEQRHVQDGFLEMSCVKPTTEMMELIEASRAFEANTQMIRHHDTLLGSLVNRVMKPV